MATWSIRRLSRSACSENQALNQPVTEGETPTIVRKKKGMLEGLF